MFRLSPFESLIKPSHIRIRASESMVHKGLLI